MNKSSAYCGLFCEACPLYITTSNGTATDEKCMGCKSDTLGKWCSQCRRKTCAREKGVEFCIECASYPCQLLIDFKEDERAPYHEDIFNHLEMIKKHGEEHWRTQMNLKYRSKDGKRIDWYEERKQRNK